MPSHLDQLVRFACLTLALTVLACSGGTSSDGVGGDSSDDVDEFGCGGPYGRAELDAAWAHFLEVGQRGSAKFRCSSLGGAKRGADLAVSHHLRVEGTRSRQSFDLTGWAFGAPNLSAHR